MISFRLIFFVAVAVAVGCELSPKIPNGGNKNYPGMIKDSSDRRTVAEREWRRMLDAYGAQQTPPDLHPIIHTPRSLLGVSGGIKVTQTQPGSETIALREVIKGFIDRWRDLLGVDPTTVSLVSADESGDINRLTYRQANYPFPVVNNYGEMNVVISKDGRIMQLDDRFIPVVELPQTPTVERDAAAQRLVGRTFTYADIAGREQRAQINNRDEISVKRLVVFPLEKGDSLEVHLAWEVVVGTSLSWTVYVDATNGEELKAVQNFQT